MRRKFLVIAFAIVLAAVPNAALAQKSTEVELLKKEIDLLKRELDLLKRENDLLKAELASLKKGGKAKAAEDEPDRVMRVVVEDVEYVYQGSVRANNKVIVTVLATSKDGAKVPPNGTMVLVDDKGNKFTGRALHSFMVGASLREGIPVKLNWEFGGTSPFGGNPFPAPSAKITQFAGVIIHRTVANDDNTIDFRNVPAVVEKEKVKSKTK